MRLHPEEALVLGIMASIVVLLLIVIPTSMYFEHKAKMALIEHNCEVNFNEITN